MFSSINASGVNDDLASTGNDSEDEIGPGENFGLKNKSYMDLDSTAFLFRYHCGRPQAEDAPPPIPGPAGDQPAPSPRMTGVGEVPGRLVLEVEVDKLTD